MARTVATPEMVKTSARLQPLVKIRSGLMVIAPEPRFDWDKLRRLKQGCEGCGLFNRILGDCSKGYLPGCEVQ